MANNVIGSIPYSLGLRLVNPGDAESAKKIAATLQQRETISLQMLAQHMSDHGTPFSKGVIAGVLIDMVNCTVELLKAGYGVNIDGLAKFSLHAKSKMVEYQEDFNPATDIKLKIRSTVDSAAESEVNTDPDYEYVPNREQQAAAKKAARAALPNDPGTGDDNGGGTSGGEGGSDDDGNGVTE